MFSYCFSQTSTRSLVASCIWFRWETNWGSLSNTVKKKQYKPIGNVYMSCQLHVNVCCFGRLWINVQYVKCMFCGGYDYWINENITRSVYLSKSHLQSITWSYVQHDILETGKIGEQEKLAIFCHSPFSPLFPVRQIKLIYSTIHHLSINNNYLRIIHTISISITIILASNNSVKLLFLLKNVDFLYIHVHM